jgi:WD40 repeat protein
MAVGHDDGTVAVLCPLAHSLSRVYSFAPSSGRGRVTGLAWRPPTEMQQNVLLAARGSQVQAVHISTSKVLSGVQMSPVGQAAEAILSMAASPHAGYVAVGGAEGSVQLLDSRGASLQTSLQSGGSVPLGTESGHGHSNRVFALYWTPDDPNMLFSGGWDSTVQVPLHMNACAVQHCRLYARCCGLSCCLRLGARPGQLASWFPTCSVHVLVQRSHVYTVMQCWSLRNCYCAITLSSAVLVTIIEYADVGRARPALCTMHLRPVFVWQCHCSGTGHPSDRLLANSATAPTLGHWLWQACQQLANA